MAFEWSEGAAKGLRVLGSIDPWVLKCNSKILDYRHVAAVCNTKQHEDVAVIISGNITC